MSKRTEMYLTGVDQRATGDAIVAAIDNVGGPTGTGVWSQIAVVAGMRHKFQGGFQADSHRIAGMTGGEAEVIHPVAKGSAACRRGLLCIGEGQFVCISPTLCV